MSPPTSPVPVLSPNFFLGRQLVSSIESPPRPSRPATLNGIVFDRDWSGRTFNIPDCPAKHSVGTLKAWYIRNICPSAQPNTLSIVSRESNTLIQDDTPFWHLAAGEECFSVSVAHRRLPATQPIPSSITLYLEHEGTGISTAVHVPLNSTLSQLKILAFKQLSLGDASAALDPRVGFTLGGSTITLDNNATVQGVCADGDRLFLNERHTPPSSHRANRTPSPAREEDQYNSIAGIWACDTVAAPGSELDVSAPAWNSERRHSAPDPLMRSGTLRSTRQEAELERIKSSWRTKMCRSGGGHCKFGQSCWFAHNKSELRKPSDALPANCPGVSKLEKYAKRQDAN